ncbi:NACHT domain-containing NTPase [Aulosira sp. FACHB-615]|uniref:NACHT domain-containing protein n=1 Tax=Aulosira sp. FACHB-615 TaxID=2692777 RepID=UPI0016820DE9|nr:NACHT domain-containing protein [Aulosira sp. FACHB-615]MBD2490427.1 NACHT domain-containing protein [Aulosira sp. FACHB-615]
MDIKIGFNSNQFTSDEPQIIDVFNHDEIGGKLLIIGEPGSGKTTTLLELAQILVTLAEEQHLKPIPVLLNLASWQNPRQPFRQWIIVELSMKYGQSSQTIEQWLNEQKLLPLLDGLDELESSLYQDCIRGINIFLSEVNRPPSLIVCTRKEEYINAKIKLKLNGAVCLLPLSDDQIQNYLQQIQNFPHSHTLIQDTILMDLIRIPLFLNLAIVTCQEISLEKWQKIDSSEERLQYLWNTYIYKRLIDDNNAKSKKIRVWLTWIAQQLAQESKFDFVIAQLQPSKTLYGNQKNIYILILFIIISSIVEICIHINNGLEIKLIKNEIPQLIMLINDIMPQLIIAILVVSFSLAFSYFIKPLMLFLLKIIKFIFSRFSNLLGIFNSIIYLPLSISIFIIFIYKISSLAGLLVLYFLILLPFNILPFNYNYESFDLLHWLAFPVKFFKNITILIAITAIAFCLALPIFFAFFLLSILVSVGLIIVFINVIQPIEKLIVS